VNQRREAPPAFADALVGSGFPQQLPVAVGIHGGAGQAENEESGGEEFLAEQPVDGGDELAPGEVAGSAEDNQAAIGGDGDSAGRRLKV